MIEIILPGLSSSTIGDLSTLTLHAPSGNILDVAAAGTYNIFSSVGANTLTIGGASTIVSIPGTVSAVNMNTVDADGNITITISNTGNESGLTVNQNDVTNNPAAVIIANTGSGDDITLPNSSSIKNGVMVMATSVTANSALFTGGTNTFDITNGTAGFNIAADSVLDINADLTVSTATTLDQDVASGSNVTFGTIAGTLTTVAQGNITSVGTLSGLTMGGNIVMGGNSITSTVALPITIGSSAGHDFSINATVFMVEGDTGRIGIGTAAPVTALHITNGSGTTNGLTIGGDLGLGGNVPFQIVHTNALMVVERRAAGTTLCPEFVLSKTNGTFAAPAAVVNGNCLGKYKFNGHDGTDSLTTAATIECYVNNTVSGNVIPGKVFITTADAAGALTERISFDSAGLTTVTGTFKTGASANSTNFAANGRQIMVGTAKVIKHKQIIDQLGQGSSAPSERFDEAPYASFTYAEGDDSHITFEAPEDMDFTVDVTLKVHWYSHVSQTGDEVNWQIVWNARAPGETVNAGSTTVSSGDINVPVQFGILESTIDTIAGNSIAAGDLIGLEFERIAIVDGTDPDMGSIHVMSVEFEYTSDKLGE